MIGTVLAFLVVGQSPAPAAASAPVPAPVVAKAPTAAPAVAVPITMAPPAAPTGDPSRAHLASWHDLLAAEPHMAGTPGDAKVIGSIASAFREMGLQVEVHPFWAYLPRPREPIVEIVTAPDDAPLAESTVPGARRGVMRLAVREENLAIDPQLAHPGLSFAWNAYSGAGDVTGEIVYANYGTKADFDQLKSRGIDLQGKVCLARYGGNFRGFKAKWAEEAGAAAMIIFTDPGDSGPAKGATWPDGGWANASCIQRGSINTLPYCGDPLTPFVEATERAPRLDPSTVGLPTIPVQPIGWGAAREIVRRMRGDVLFDPSWATGFDGATRLTGGPALRVRVMVRHEPAVVQSSNVIARLPGRAPDGFFTVVGCHHDAWGYGAADPLAGTIVLMESARVCAEQARAGQGPARDTLFCAWGAEEFGIVGSTEWVERERPTLQSKCLAYINLDMASMGTQFSASATPSLRGIIEEVARGVPSASRPDQSVRDSCLKEGSMPCADMGGGSDHQPFVCHAGVPSIGLSAGGSAGTSYHSNYDTLAWYRSVVGSDYSGASMLTRMTVGLIDALGTRTPDPAQDLLDAARRLRVLAALPAAATEAHRVIALAERMDALARRVRADAPASASASQHLTQCWIDASGLPGRPWCRNVFASADADSGYGAWVLPGVQRALADHSPTALAAAIDQLTAAVDRFESALSPSAR